MFAKGGVVPLFWGWVVLDIQGGSKCLGGGDKGIFVNNEVPYIKIFLELNNKYVIFQFFLKFYNYFSNLQLYVYNFQLSAIGGSSQEPSKPPCYRHEYSRTVKFHRSFTFFPFFYSSLHEGQSTCYDVIPLM